MKKEVLKTERLDVDIDIFHGEMNTVIANLTELRELYLKNGAVDEPTIWYEDGCYDSPDRCVIIYHREETEKEVASRMRKIAISLEAAKNYKQKEIQKKKKLEEEERALFLNLKKKYEP